MKSPRQIGVSILELLIAMALGLLVVAAAIQLFLTSRATYTMSMELARLQENARTAMTIMARDLRMAGFFGCASNSITPRFVGISFNPLASCTADSRNTDFNRPISGLNGSTAASDCLTVHYADNNRQFPLIGNLAALDQALAVEGSVSAAALGDYALIADCRGADVFEVDGVSGNQITPAADLTRWYGVSANGGAVVYPLRTVRYYVQNDPDNNNEPTLYRKLDNEADQPLVAGVEHMRLIYGEGNGNLDSADEVDFDRVVSVRLALLLRSGDTLRVADASKYELLCTDDIGADCRTLGPFDDERLRSLLESTFSVRNRLD